MIDLLTSADPADPVIQGIASTEAVGRGINKTKHQHDLHAARIAARAGMVGSLRLLMEARAAGILDLPQGWALALALRTQETGTEGDGNVFGHDPTIFVGAGEVTRDKYLRYKRRRGPTGRGGMQGVGPLQLTYWTFQDRADSLGGCWIERFCYQVGYEDLAHLIHVCRGDVALALAIYNGGAANPNHAYARSVIKHQSAWHKLLSK